MIDIRQKLDEIGPFVPGADDGLLVCRCEEVTKGEIRKHFYHRGNAKIFEKRNGTLSGTDLQQTGEIHYGCRIKRSAGLCGAGFGKSTYETD